MESSIIQTIMAAFNVSEPMAVLIIVFVAGAVTVASMVIGLLVRIKMHADHFNVNDTNIDRANKNSFESSRQAHSATRDAAYTRGYVVGRQEERDKWEANKKAG